MKALRPVLFGTMRRFAGTAGGRRAALLLVISCITAATILADNWSYFLPVGDNVSVSFAPVDNATYTWKFRNDGYNRIKYLEFSYSYIDANTGQYRTDQDVFPGSLGPGQTFGGWSAFTANSRSQPIIRITRIERE